MQALLKGINSEIVLVIDANILFAALIKKGTTAELMLNPKIHLFAPDFLNEELTKYETELSQKIGGSVETLKNIIEELIGYISLVPRSVWEKDIQEIKDLIPDKTDLPYISLAKFLNCPLWSNDAILKHQKEVKVYSTQELITLLGF